MTDTTERAKFEAWASKQQGYGTAGNAPDYAIGAVRDAWKVWQAARASQAAPMPVAEGWRPIATAPRSIQPLLVYNENCRHSIETGHYVHNMMHAAKIDGEDCFYTHWMPMPAPPSPGTPE